MKIKEINFKNFRNIKEINIIPDEEMNIICGENAQGKTNILEGIWLLSGAKSFRTKKDSSFIKFEEKKSIINSNVLSENNEKEIKLEIEEKRKFFINQKRSNLSSFVGNFRAIIFSPSDLSIVESGPSERRKFLDISIGQIYPQYINTLKTYNRAVFQRNSLLKEYKYDSTVLIMLESFEEEIAKNGEKIIFYRKKYLENLKEFLNKIYEEISGGKEKLYCQYISLSKEKSLKKELVLKRKEDMLTGTTSIGPHRDDIEFKINDIEARSFASQGQKRSIAISLKLAEAEVINSICGEYPVCLLDDIMSELDPIRQNYILNHIKGKQVFLSCCDPSNIKNLQSGKIFKIKNGEII